jgi:hypothetical protein
MAIKDMRLVQRCQALSKVTGKPCRSPAIRGGRVCIVHGGASPVAKAEAQRRIACLVDPALEVMWELLTDKKTPPAVRKDVAKDILDRAGFKPVDKSEHTFVWDGDPSKLTEEQAEQLAYSLEQLAYGVDKARALNAKRKELIAAGAGPEVIEAEFTKADEVDW